MALRNLQQNFFQTFLSILGVVIGVAALVAMLSVIDGLEAYARQQIVDNSSLENVSVRSNEQRQLNGIWLDRDTVARLAEDDLHALLTALPFSATGQLVEIGSTIVNDPNGGMLGVRYAGYTLPALNPPPDSLLLYGSFLETGSAAAVVNENFALHFLEDQELLSNALGRKLPFLGDSVTIGGITRSGESDELRLGLPLSVLTGLPEAPEPTPDLLLAFADPNEVLEGQAFTDTWLANRFPEVRDAFESNSNEGYLKELQEGILIFRLCMGFLVGIAVLVGGIGVMNVLLMSVTERTAEIGIRKALGATRGNILRQFLGESLVISSVGCAVGALVGFGIAAIAARTISYFVEGLAFTASVGWGTVGTIVVVALLVGVLFGTYPARRAARLDPVEAMRR